MLIQIAQIYASLKIKENVVKLKMANGIRAEMLQELKNEIKDVNATDVLVAEDFNEDVSDNYVQEFMVEIELCEVFSQDHEVYKNNRYGTFELGIKCTDYSLGLEGIIRIVEGIELIEFNEIVDSYHRGCLTELNLEIFFKG